MTSCCVKGCGETFLTDSANVANDSRYSTHSISFHKFPKKKAQKEIWLKAIGNPYWDVPATAHVCSRHFSSQQLHYITHNEYKIKDGGYPDTALPESSLSRASTYRLNVCRFCLVTDCKMFSLQSGVLKTCLETIAGLQENHDVEALPQQLCYICAANLMKMYNVIEKSMIAQAILLEVYAENLKITKKLIHEQDRKKLNLVHNLQSHNSTPSTIYDYVYDDELNASVLVSNKFECDKKEDDKSTKDSSCGDMSDSESEVRATQLNNLCRKLRKDIDESEDLLTEIYEENFALDEDVSTQNIFANSKVTCSNSVVGSKDVDMYYEDLNNKCTDNCEKSTVREYLNLDSTDSDDDDRTKIENFVYSSDHDYLFTCNDDNKLRTIEDVHNVVKTGLQKKITKKIVRFRTDNTQSIEAKKSTYKQKTIFSRNSVNKNNSSNEKNSTITECFDIAKLTIEEQKQQWVKICERPSNAQEIYQCDVCSKWLRAGPFYFQHITKHDPQCGNYECLVCKMRFEKEYLLQRHVLMTHSKKYLCKLCPAVMYNLATASYHRRLEHSKKYQCTQCSRGYTTKLGLSIHMSTVHQIHPTPKAVRWYKCETCCQTFASKIAHQEHLSTCQTTTASPLLYATMISTTCDTCGLQCHTRLQLVAHKRNAHASTSNGGVEFPTKCNYCDMIMASRVYQRRHVLKFHPEASKKFMKDRRRSARLERKENTTVSLSEKYLALSSKKDPRFLVKRVRQKRGLGATVRRHVKSKDLHSRNTKYKFEKEHQAELYECPICDSIFNTTIQLNQHIINVHEHRRLQFPEMTDPCKGSEYLELDEVFSEEEDMEDSHLVEIGKKTYRCETNKHVISIEDSETETCSEGKETFDNDREMAEKDPLE